MRSRRSGWVYFSIGHSPAAAFSVSQTKDRVQARSRLHVYNQRLCRVFGARAVEAVLVRTARADPRLMCQIAGAVYLPVVFLSSRGRGLISSLGCVLLGHVFALPRRAVKTRAFPVVNPCLGVDPHLAMASAGCGWVGRFLGHAPCRRWAYGRTRCWLRLGLLWSGLLLGRSRWRLGG